MSRRTRLRRHWPLVIPVAVSAVLSSWALGTMGWGNSYYSAAVRSMADSWHAFWYGSLDSVGFITVDKPPVSLQVQALVVKVFGFHQMSLLVPQVVAGVLAVVLVYAAVVKRWGRIGATVGALALAVSPISVMVNHSNNTDAILTLAMTATVWAGVRAAETRRWRWVVATGVLFGLSFTTKMLAAAPVLPAVLLAMAVAVGLSWRRQVAMVGGMAALASVCALAWFSFVDLTPASQRPYVGSSATNSAYQLAFARNGVNQVEGNDPTSGGGPGGGRPGGGPGGGFGGGFGPSGFSGGSAGALRLFNSDLGGQVGWLIVPAVAGALGAAVVAGRRRWWREPSQVAPAVWFAAGAGIYSITAGIVHPYYTASIVPPLAMLIGAGIGAARHTWQRRATRVALGATVFATGVVGWVIARRVHWQPAIATALIVAAFGIIMAVVAFAMRRTWPRWVLGAGALALVATPAVWTVGSLRAGLNANLPYANPGSSGALFPGGFGGPGGPGGSGGSGGPGGSGAQVDAALVSYLEQHRGTADWLVAVPSAMTAAPIIITTGEPVMAMGGFSGSDAALDTAGFDALVSEGRVRYVLLRGSGPGGFGGGGPGGFGGGGPGGGNNQLTGYIAATCLPVTAVSDSLYDCGG